MAYTNIDDPSAHFTTTLYTGNGSANHAITNDANAGNFQPDMLWYKSRSYASSHILYDSSRTDANFLTVNTTAQEKSDANMLESFDANGFTLNADTDGNRASNTFVGWQWKVNGGTTASNSDGSLTSTVQANTTAGFSIVTYSNPSTNDNTIGHGLGVQPEIIIFKNTVDTINWYVASKYLSNYTTKYLELDTTDAEQTHADGMNSTAPTSSVFSVGGISRTGDSGNLAVAYCFASKQGYSKFGKYVGNGNVNGSFVYTGFKPAWVMTKRTDTTSGWFIQDIKRGIRNSSSGTALEANSNLAESGIGATNYDIDFLSNGFKLRQSNAYLNASGGTYIFMAFASSPFTTSTGIPTTAR